MSGLPVSWPAITRALAKSGVRLTPYGQTLAALTPCLDCQSQYDARVFRGCPYCAVNNHRKPEPVRWIPAKPPDVIGDPEPDAA